MKKRESIFTFSLVTAMLLFMAACGGGEELVLPTLAPTYTPTPAITKETGPTPTMAPDAYYTKIIELDGEDFNQTSYFDHKNGGTLSVKPLPYSGNYSFYMTNRDDTTHGVTLNFSNKNGDIVNVIGKKVHIAVWVYQESGSPQDFSCTLYVKKPDSTTDTPEKITANSVPSGQWTLLEGDIPVYSNVTNPTITLTMTSSKADFYFDDIRLTYDQNSSVAANSAYNIIAFNGLYFNFEDQETHLEARGSGQPSIVSESCDDGSYCLFVSGRVANWNGAQIDLSEYGLAGTQIWVSFSAKHDGSEKNKVTCSLQQRAAGATQDKYANITSTEVVFPDTWAEATGKITIGSTSESVILYFETSGTEDFYIDNVLISTKDPSTITIDPNNQENPIVEPTEKIDTTGFTVIHSLTGDNSKKESQIFSSRGSASASIVTDGYDQNGFLISGRSDTWNGVGLDFTNINDKSFNVVGKEVYVSFWVYQDSGAPLDFSATLQVNKPDGSATWPERVTVEVLPSGEWTYVEGIIPVYANVSAPQINFEIPSSKDASFILDNVTVSYNPKSSVDINPEYVIGEKLTFTGLTLDFESNEAFFQARGNGKPSLVYGGHESNMCLAVTGRTATWHGVQADLSDYDLAGKTIEVSYWLYHESTTPFEIHMTAEQNDGSLTTYTPVIVADPISDGKWVQFSNTYTVPSTAKKFVLYFESPVADASFFVDDVSIQLVK